MHSGLRTVALNTVALNTGMTERSPAVIRPSAAAARAPNLPWWPGRRSGGDHIIQSRTGAAQCRRECQPSKSALLFVGAAGDASQLLCSKCVLTVSSSSRRLDSSAGLLEDQVLELPAAQLPSFPAFWPVNRTANEEEGRIRRRR